MNVKELKEIIEDLPDGMPVQLLDYTTDDDNDCNYHINKEDVCVVNGISDVDDPDSVRMNFVAIQFENKLNPNPLD